jgi:hypothetical protein
MLTQAFFKKIVYFVGHRANLLECADVKTYNVVFAEHNIRFLLAVLYTALKKLQGLQADTLSVVLSVPQRVVFVPV